MKKSSRGLKITCILFLLFTLFSMNKMRNDYNELSRLFETTTKRYLNTVETKNQLKQEITDLNKCLTDKTKENNQLKNQLEDLKNENNELTEQLQNMKRKNDKLEKQKPQASRGNNRALSFKATAYDLSLNSCGKPVGSKGYGVTANGTNLTGKTRQQAMTVAVDPEIIKLGSKLKITFPEPYDHFSGIYTANDTGGAIKGNKIDVFMGDFKSNKTHQSVWDFGVRDVRVEVLK